MRVLVMNAGSSSLKTSVIDGGRTVARRAIPWSLPPGGADTPDDERTGVVMAALEELIHGGVPAGSIEAVGHRVVHGGTRFTAPVLVDDEVLAALGAATSLAPIHNPIAVATIAAARRILPGVPHGAAFDTAFHVGLPEAQRRYPVPERWFRDWGVQRHGFHGLSVEWATGRAAELLGERVEHLGLVVGHLGSGCSVTAVEGGRSVATSMGMTPLEGLMMGTRAGSIDPGILLAVLRGDRLDLDELAEALEHGSGLLGVSGTTADMRRLEEAAAAGDERARLAIDMFVARAAAGIAGAATALRRLDGIVFTGGIGEHAAGVRASIAARLGPVGVAGISGAGDTDDAVLSAAGDRPAVLRIETREDLVIATAVERLVDA